MNEGDDQSENWQRLTRIIKDIKDSLTLTLKLRLQSPSAHAMRASKAQVGVYVCVSVCMWFYEINNIFLILQLYSA